MADRFKFNQVAKKLKITTNRFLRGGIILAQKEMKENFKTESSKESGQMWPSLKYRTQPPPKLDLTSILKEQCLNNKPYIFGNKAVLTIDPLDSNKKFGSEHGYASFHQDGTPIMAQREFCTQSQDLTEKQVELLINELDRVFT